MTVQGNRLEPDLGSRQPGLVEASRQQPTRALTAARGIAAWWIVAFHFREALPSGTPSIVLQVVDRGYLAVDLFFILSGYVICFNYLPWFTKRRFRFETYGRFLALRLSRIYPVHGFMLLLFLINPLAVMVFSSRRDLGNLHWSYYGASLVLAQNWGLTPGLYWNVPAWSISAEWLAYLAFPALAYLTVVLTKTMAGCFAFIASALALLAIATSLISPAGLGHGGQAFWSLRCVLEFVVGIGLGIAGRSAPRSRHDTRLALGIAVLCIGTYAVTGVPDYTAIPLGFTALVYCLIDEGGWVAAVLRIRALQWLGTVSYSTYMVHYFLKIWVKFVLIRPGVPSALAFAAYVLAVLVGSAILHRVIEYPGQQMARRYLATQSKAVARL